MNSSGVLDSMWHSDMERTFMILLRKHKMHPDDFKTNESSDWLFIATFNVDFNLFSEEIIGGLCISHNDCLQFKDKQLFDKFEENLINFRNSKWYSKSKTCLLEKLEILTNS